MIPEFIPFPKMARLSREVIITEKIDGTNEKRFSLFNVARWCLHGETPGTIATDDPRIVKTQDVLPPCCHLVPVLHRGIFSTGIADAMLCDLAERGSKAAPGFMKPEGVVVYHIAGGVGFQKTIEGDSEPKSKGGRS